MDYTYNKIAVGGTFDKFHKGHEQLIKTAFEMAENVLIGISSDDFASRKSHDVESCEKRIKNVKEAIKDYSNNYTIIAIDDPMGTADIDAELDAIVVSEETEESAVYINKIRHDNGLKLLDIVVIEWVLADDEIPISSTRIRKGEITQDGIIISE